DLKKIDPAQGAKRIFSLRALVELLKSLFKIAFIGTITFAIIWMYKDDMMEMALKHAASALLCFGWLTIIMGITSALDLLFLRVLFGGMTIIMGIASALALLFLAVFDYAYQRYDYEKSIRMSKQDIKDEQKNIEGDPLIKSKIKERQQQMATRRMMSEVPKADVVITNPTHYAVAIKYDEKQASAPYIVAKGTD